MKRWDVIVNGDAVAIVEGETPEEASQEAQARGYADFRLAPRPEETPMVKEVL